ncbi:cytochrome-c peroxidase [Psychroflexus planctonicus]|uniref:Methylamine utilization protein n=1 Tax=Psychroflexus planctonicus TaxID=1526575 RepID=A0ABQ1SL97_9FLAO|nr:cytochrome c peroxidase [Psychroflexus planctonicus]GGE44875.1 methylamine utilization protein [Psychroflexus planctonicus]
MKQFLTYLSFTFVLFLVSCNQDSKSDYEDVSYLREVYSSGNNENWPNPNLHESVDVSSFEDIGALPHVVFPENNPYTKEKATLGEDLFFDPRLSSSGQIACASCHNPKKGWTDGIEKSIGHKGIMGKRNAMTIINIAHSSSLFWDGRVKTLEEQVSFPIEDPTEMNQDFGIALSQIASLPYYQEKFKAAFEDGKVSDENLRKAIATFQRTIQSKDSKFDQFVKGNDTIFSDEEVLGLHLYRTKANCISCHNTPYFSDNQFHNDGQTLLGSRHEDLGLFNITKDTTDLGKFRTPTLREIELTGPWMHHGNFPTLKDVVQYYNHGNPAPISKKHLKTNDKRIAFLKSSEILEPLQLTNEEVGHIIQFLKTLSSQYTTSDKTDLVVEP